MLTVGDKFPTFAMTAVNGTDPKTAFTPVTNASYAGKWLVLFAWPKDFTFVCPTEIVGFDGLARDFRDRDAELLACRSTATSSISLGGKAARIWTKSAFPGLPTSSASCRRRSASSTRRRGWHCARPSSSTRRV
jgi:AhpC/TSA family